MTPDDVRGTLARFPRERTWLLPALREVQHGERWLSPDALDAVAAHLRVPASEVWGVATHYPELRLARPGRRIVRVCTGVACAALGARELLTRCEQRLGLRAGETAHDASVTLEELDCAFACAIGPVIEIDHVRRGRVTLDDDLPAILTVDQVAKLLGISRGLAFAAARGGQIPVIRIGRRILVPRDRLRDLIHLLWLARPRHLVP